jgi:hypothetical protein
MQDSVTTWVITTVLSVNNVLEADIEAAAGSPEQVLPLIYTQSQSLVF